MRTVFLALLTSVAALVVASANDNLDDVDVEQIGHTVQTVTTGQIVQIRGASQACMFTAEDACTLEVQVDVAEGSGLTNLTISKIDNHWTIGRWQKERLAFARCVYKQNFGRSCYGLSGHVGGMRSSPLNVAE